MKFIASIVILKCAVLITVFPDNYAREARPVSRHASWGYVYHASKLSGEYLARTIPRFDVICVSGFTLDAAGRVRIARTGIINAVRTISAGQSKILYPMVTFQSAAAGRRILGSARLSAAAAGSIANLVSRNGYAGVHLDFEYLPPEDAPLLARFLKMLRKSLKGKITMAVFPPVGFPEKWSGFHDLKLIAPLVDEIVIMCYDLHGVHTGPGPVTDTGWAEKNIEYALRLMKPDRIWLGIPAYGYRWCGAAIRTISSKQGARMAKQYSSTRHRSGTLYLRWIDDGTRCEAYISDKQTRLQLEKISSRHGLAGIALWRLGFDD
ncbi:MAG: hypothetical protein JXA07_05835 [Spirochaetes bacterium]|nr:hypothetical protein [Spirochaetota bacterium]